MSEKSDLDLTWTCPETGEVFKLIGPHEDQELELMLSGKKPMAYFIKEYGHEHLFGGNQFQPYVRKGRFAEIVLRDQSEPIEWVWYCQPQEEWRGRVARFYMKKFVKGDLGSCDLTIDDWDRLNGYLLGYPAECVDFFVRREKQ